MILKQGCSLALRTPRTIPLRMKIVVPVKQVAALDDEFELLEDGSGVDPRCCSYATHSARAGWPPRGRGIHRLGV